MDLQVDVAHGEEVAVVDVDLSSFEDDLAPELGSSHGADRPVAMRRSLVSSTVTALPLAP
jgi:hypothetical protein